MKELVNDEGNSLEDNEVYPKDIHLNSLDYETIKRKETRKC